MDPIFEEPGGEENEEDFYEIEVPECYDYYTEENDIVIVYPHGQLGRINLPECYTYLYEEDQEVLETSYLAFFALMDEIAYPATGILNMDRRLEVLDSVQTWMNSVLSEMKGEDSTGGVEFHDPEGYLWTVDDRGLHIISHHDGYAFIPCTPGYGKLESSVRDMWESAVILFLYTQAEAARYSATEGLEETGSEDYLSYIQWTLSMLIEGTNAELLDDIFDNPSN